MGAGREASISLDGVRDKNVMQLKKLNTALFPVRYNNKYYDDAIASRDFTKLGHLPVLFAPYLFWVFVFFVLPIASLLAVMCP